MPIVDNTTKTITKTTSNAVKRIICMLLSNNNQNNRVLVPHYGLTCFPGSCLRWISLRCPKAYQITHSTVESCAPLIKWQSTGQQCKFQLRKLQPKWHNQNQPMCRDQHYVIAIQTCESHVNCILQTQTAIVAGHTAKPRPIEHLYRKWQCLMQNSTRRHQKTE